MTRINTGIPVKTLSREHLLAEHREIKRIPNCIVKGRYSLKGQPKRFKLGQGHVKFFYDKLGYLLKRYKQIYQECIKRGFNVQDYSSAWDKAPKELIGDYIPTKKDIEIVKERIKQNNMIKKSKNNFKEHRYDVFYNIYGDMATATVRGKNKTDVKKRFKNIYGGWKITNIQKSK